MREQVQRIRVWPGMLRTVHWALALAVSLLLLSGWLMGSGMVLNDRLYQFLLEQVHLPAGHVLGVALAIRGWYLVADDRVGGWRSLLPRMTQLQGMLAVLRFYASLGRGALPGYYAHNPLWAPLYLLLLLLLLLQLLSGLMLEFTSLRGLFGLSSVPLLHWHQGLLPVLAFLTVAHVVSAFLHDLRGNGSDVSGMINGHRTFAAAQRSDVAGSLQAPAVSLNDIGGWKPTAGQHGKHDDPQ
jgi:Ni/Fe-hydrogenase 1 B-type cytochrome subunit